MEYIQVTHLLTHLLTELNLSSRPGFQAFQTIKNVKKGFITIITITAIMTITVSMAIAAIRAITDIRAITATGCSLRTVNGNVPFNFYLILILV